MGKLKFHLLFLITGLILALNIRRVYAEDWPAPDPDPAFAISNTPLGYVTQSVSPIQNTDATFYCDPADCTTDLSAAAGVIFNVHQDPNWHTGRDDPNNSAKR